MAAISALLLFPALTGPVSLLVLVMWIGITAVRLIGKRGLASGRPRYALVTALAPFAILAPVLFTSETGPHTVGSLIFIGILAAVPLLLHYSMPRLSRTQYEGYLTLFFALAILPAFLAVTGITASETAHRTGAGPQAGFFERQRYFFHAGSRDLTGWVSALAAVHFVRIAVSRWENFAVWARFLSGTAVAIAAALAALCAGSASTVPVVSASALFVILRLVPLKLVNRILTAIIAATAFLTLFAFARNLIIGSEVMVLSVRPITATGELIPWAPAILLGLRSVPIFHAVILLRRERAEDTAFVLSFTIILFAAEPSVPPAALLYYGFFAVLEARSAPDHAFPAEVFINGRYLTQTKTGVQRFAAEVMSNLDPSRITATFLVPGRAPVGSTDGFDTIRLRPFGGYLWEQVVLPLFLFNRGNAVLVNLCNLAPMFHRRQIVTLHDVGFAVEPRWYSRGVRAAYRIMVPQILRSSEVLTTVSAFSEREMRRIYGITRGISVIPNAVPDAFLDKTAVPHRRRPWPYILCVGAGSARKNVKTVVEAFFAMERHDVHLVLTGRRDDAFYGAESRRGNHVRMHVYDDVDDDELADLYSGALLLAFLPYYEGYGLPILEAMHFGCPVLASDIPVFREEFGDAVRRVDHTNPMLVARELDRLAGDREARNALSADGLRFCAVQTYRESADRLAALIEDMTGRTDGHSGGGRS